MNKEERLSLGPLTTEEEKHYMARLLDKVHIAERTRRIQTTDFIDPHLQQLSNRLIINYPEVNFIFDGGSINSERKRLIICPQFCELASNEEYVALLDCEGNCPPQKYIAAKITHRDFLGTFLGTGIRREKLGDIWPLEKGCVIAVAREITDYLGQQPLKVKGVPLQIKEIEPGSFQTEDKDSKIIETTVSSVRLDAVAAAGFATSRSKLTREILAGRFKVNWQEIARLDYQLNEGDVISCRGRGRVVIESIHGQTKKGRIKLSLKRLN
ncbi:MAG: photosystem II S4 domain protein [Firmicutes bacterium HGW-Firmicutes-12]|jgi:RNA-binding protein YlmH|nr:MAG: photosystem II S4 domain protein [Firmicutes bacterium HGW-Firmicutes-12]